MRNKLDDGSCCKAECGTRFDAEERQYLLQKCDLMARTAKSRVTDYLFISEIYRGLQHDDGQTIVYEVFGRR